jgi:hypothetical protein
MEKRDIVVKRRCFNFGLFDNKRRECVKTAPDALFCYSRKRNLRILNTLMILLFSFFHLTFQNIAERPQ